MGNISWIFKYMRRYRFKMAVSGIFAVLSGGCALAHVLALPFPYVASVMPYDFTSVIVLALDNRPGEYVFPRLELFNDCAHIRRGPGTPSIQRISE